MAALVSFAVRGSRRLPNCAETIKKEAKICRFCNTDLDKGRPMQKQEPKEVQARSSVEDGVKLGCGMFIVLPLIIIGILFFLPVLAAGSS